MGHSLNWEFIALPLLISYASFIIFILIYCFSIYTTSTFFQLLSCLLLNILREKKLTNFVSDSDLLFFIRYILYLHFKWYPLSWIPPSQKSHEPSSFPVFPNHPLPIPLSWCSPTLLHWAFSGWGSFPSFSLGILWYVNCFLGILSFWVNICLSVSAYQVCSFVIGSLHSGWHSPVPPICLRI